MGLFYSIEEEFEISIFDNEENYRFFAIETIDDLVSLISGAVIS